MLASAAISTAISATTLIATASIISEIHKPHEYELFGHRPHQPGPFGHRSHQHGPFGHKASKISKGDM